MKFDRSILEQARPFKEMCSIVSQFLDDPAICSDCEVQYRVGVIKDIVEEYVPLIQLAKVLPGFISARLTPPSYTGPDALLLMSNGSELGVQITIAGEGYSTALQREMLTRGKIVFPNQSAYRDKSTKDIKTSGRILTTRSSNTQKMICEVIFALEKKRSLYRSGSHLLLISTSRPLITLENNWLELLTSSIKHRKLSLYDEVYINVGDQCIGYRELLS